jgi:hypothetical protein
MYDAHETSFSITSENNGPTKVDSSDALMRRIGIEPYTMPELSVELPSSALAHERPMVAGTLDDPNLLRPMLAAVLLARNEFGHKILDVQVAV